MEKRIIGLGVLFGALGGLLAFVFARVLSEPIIDRAIDYEGGREDARLELDRAAGHAVEHVHEAELFTRSVQANAGLGFGIIVFGAAVGALFAVVYCIALGRAARLAPRPLALLVAGGMFLALYGVPFVKYPPNPPAVGNADTIAERTGLHLAMVALTVALLLAAIWLSRKLQARLGVWNAAVLAGAAFVVVMGVVMALLPWPGELGAEPVGGGFATDTPRPLTDPSGRIVFPGFPADDLYYFRLYSLLGQVILWTVIGFGMATLAPRLLARAGHRDESAPAAPA
ncbi:CbtA family protein [Nocardia sp. CDC159]|uniref:CbtA family protein n=1 Tax=Nocardia pulmonis TaxID=2951408 RepID=A0A9X2E1I4_9NOCA|nr:MULTISPECIES: CbtA family protein [Nocardia]MCM6772307.1 CbtA family protein [Nocardia pulmonis]MCM6785035.1 CbtA family protein [Nocardia sp. CDC159]